MKQHTSRAFAQELEQLREMVLRMGGHVETAIAEAMRALVERDPDLARKCIREDHAVNRMEVDIDELCVSILARRQPAAEDLRLLISGLKTSTDLERIGDLAVNMCERTLDLLEVPSLKPLIDLPRMAELARGMLSDALNAYVKGDAGLAEQVCIRDDLVDRLNEQVFRELITYIMEDPHTISQALALMMISRYLERIADHATNIAEMVIYHVKGRDIRHMRVGEEHAEKTA
ncbi:MAG TPA: phosphate signaling complex protein PhoU [Deferrisomatales bacterium]|nr:phosphate signaling complex protein PhoU [Deferrisomatales bacterium]